MGLNYPGGSNVITRVLMRGGGKQQGQRQRRRCAERDREKRERKEDWKIEDSMILVLRTARGDFPGGPVAKTPCSQFWGPGFDPWSGN